MYVVLTDEFCAAQKKYCYLPWTRQAAGMTFLDIISKKHFCR